MPRELKLPVPVHVVTGGLGAGKTTFIQALLRQKPAAERWALVVNEFGAVGIDQALLQASSVDLPGGDGSISVKELAGGCMCCTLSGVTSVSIAQLLRATKPDRLWIEPSGLGHPATLVDVLRGEHLGSALDLQPIICLVDCVQFRPARLPWGAQPDFWANELYRDQVSIADVLIGSKADLAGAEAVRGFQRWAGGLYPPKQQVLTAAKGIVNLGGSSPGCSQVAGGSLGLEALSISVTGQQQGQQQAARPSRQLAAAPSSGGLLPGPAAPNPTAAQCPLPAARVRAAGGLVWLSNAEQPAGPQPGWPQRKVAQDGRLGMVACGWVFHPGDVFDRFRLELFLGAAQALAPRVKGVFRVGPKTWVSASAGTAAGALGGVGGTVELQEVAYRRDSRLELLLPALPTPVAAGSTEPAAGAGDVGGSGSGGTSSQEAGSAEADSSAATANSAAAAEAGAGDEPVAGSSGVDQSDGSEMAGLEPGSIAAAIDAGRQGDWSRLEGAVLSLLLARPANLKQ